MYGESKNCKEKFSVRERRNGGISIVTKAHTYTLEEQVIVEDLNRKKRVFKEGCEDKQEKHRERERKINKSVGKRSTYIRVCTQLHRKLLYYRKNKKTA